MADRFENGAMGAFRSSLDAKSSKRSQLEARNEHLTEEWTNLLKSSYQMSESEMVKNGELVVSNARARILEEKIKRERDKVIAERAQVAKVLDDLRLAEEKRRIDAEDFERGTAELASKFRNAMTTYSKAELSWNIEKTSEATRRIREEARQVVDQLDTARHEWRLTEACATRSPAEVPTGTELDALKDILIDAKQSLLMAEKKVNDEDEDLARKMKLVDQKIANL